MLLARDRRIMGDLVSGPILGTIGWVCTALLILLSLVLVVASVLGAV
jgi:Mn2+/Fe2+ NRAMP family transporter